MAREEELLTRLYPLLEEGKPLRQVPLSAEESRMLTGYGFLSLRPLLRVINAGDDDDESMYANLRDDERLFLRGRLEAELALMALEAIRSR